MAPCLNHFNFMQTTFFVCLLAALVIPATGSLLSHDEECFALYQFKQTFPRQDYASFGAHALRKFDSWKMITSNASESGSDCCLWDGAVCSYKEEDGHVIELDLSESFLYGPINSTSTLFNLVHLQVLNLSMNNFTESQIPSRIANLKQLRILDLSDAGFSGQVPNEISQLVQLSSLDLSWNPLIKFQSPSLDDLVKNLTRLEELHLSWVDISSSVPHFLANFSSLRSIKLIDCFLQNEFPTAILQLPKLKFLDVASNTKLTGSFPEFCNSSLLEHLSVAYTGFFGIIPESIINLNHLTFLRLSGCFLVGNIPSSLSNMTQLVYLGLAANKFTGLVPSLASHLELNFLELSGNEFQKGRLPDWLGKVSKLNELNVAEMSLYGEIPPFLANLTKLTVLNMATNSLFGRIPSSFFNLTQLTAVELGKNQLHGPISNSFSNFKSLQNLGLHGNNFSGRVELDMFLGLEKLVRLTLGFNRISFVATNNYTNGILPELEEIGLSSCNLKEYPAFLRFHNKMTAIFLSHNNIHGLLPEWTWNKNQETLEVLDLYDNLITGFHQHQHVLPWVRLRLLIISYNQLQGRLPIPPSTISYYLVSNNNLRGELPPLICELKYLRWLYLSSNNMTGTLPPCFGSLSNSLVVLDLHNNKFQGTMMNAFTRGSPLKLIDLSENQFVGQVSKSLTNCTNLEFLSLGDNSFYDIFPSWLGAHFELKVLILRSNKFYGAIQGPTNVSSQFPKLQIIDLSNNSFSGQLPDKHFQTWNAMKSADVGKSYVMESWLSLDDYFVASVDYSMIIINKGVKTEYQKILNVFTAIDLSSNNFEGEMPQALQDLRGLESLNLSNNHLTGHILPSLGNLKNLESLDLSQNKLSGEIPQQLLQLDFLSNFNVSFNHLDGHIPQANHFDTFDNSSYMGNLGLCGKPLSKECQNSKASRASQTTNEYESFLPIERVDWIVIFFGVGSGLVVGIVIGNFLYARYSDYLIERFGMRNGKWIRPLSNMRKN